MGFPVQLHAWGFIIMEGAVNAIVFVCFKTIVLYYFSKGKVRFDVLDLH
jgi:hypothetical protein